MKKQVLSFTEFINEAYSMVNEGKNWSDVKRLLSDNIDSDAKLFLSYMENCFSSDGRKGIKTNILDSASVAFGKLISERFAGEYTEIDGITTTISDIIYDKSIQGTLDVSKSNLIGTKFSTGGQEVGPFTQDSAGKMKIQDFLNMINLFNLRKLSGSTSELKTKKGTAEFANISRQDKKEGEGLWGKLGFNKIGDGKKIKGSGSEDQYYITGTGTSLAIDKWENKKKVTPISGVTPVNLSEDRGTKYGSEGYKKDKSKKAGTAEFTYVFYTLDPRSNKDSIKNQSKEYEAISGIKEVKIPVKTPDVTQKLVIQDGDTLFVTGKSDLTPEGKLNLNNAILSNFTSVSEITVQGSASQEGPASAAAKKYDATTYAKDKPYNLKLAADRADKVIEYLLKLCPGATVKAADPKSVVQDQALNEKERPSYRNVTLNINGTKVNNGAIQEKTLYVPTKGKVKYDRIIIKELQMTFEVSIQEEKAKKGGLIKGRGVDTNMYGAREKS